MLLIGRDLSPFTRRTAIVMKTLGVAFDTKIMAADPASQELVAINPLGRVPALIIDDNLTLVDSKIIVDYVLETADPEHHLIAARGPDRHAVLALAGIADGTAEKVVAAIYETKRRPEDKRHQPWLERLTLQASNGLAHLNSAAEGRQFLHGDRYSLADIYAAVSYEFTAIGYPDLVANDRYPALAALSARCSALPAFAETVPQA
jgi:glutathione S-transferase